MDTTSSDQGSSQALCRKVRNQKKLTRLYELASLLGDTQAARQPVKPDDHSEVVPLLPIPNRTVKRLSADDSVHSHVKVGHRQANTQTPPPASKLGAASLWAAAKSPRHLQPGFWIRSRAARSMLNRVCRALLSPAQRFADTNTQCHPVHMHGRVTTASPK
jgi:hypothetical protein